MIDKRVAQNHADPSAYYQHVLPKEFIVNIT